HLLRQVALLARQLGGLGGGVVAARELVGQVAQRVGRGALGLRLLLGRLAGLLRLRQCRGRLLLLRLRLLAAAELLRLVRDLLLLLLQRLRLSGRGLLRRGGQLRRLLVQLLLPAGQLTRLLVGGLLAAQRLLQPLQLALRLLLRRRHVLGLRFKEIVQRPVQRLLRLLLAGLLAGDVEL